MTCGRRGLVSIQAVHFRTAAHLERAIWVRDAVEVVLLGNFLENYAAPWPKIVGIFLFSFFSWGGKGIILVVYTLGPGIVHPLGSTLIPPPPPKKRKKCLVGW